MNNKELIAGFLREVMVGKNYEAVDRYYASDLIQHNPGVANGPEGFKRLLASRSGNPLFTYEAGLMAGDGNIVMVHGRYTGLKEVPSIVVDIFRIRDGMICEHWDVHQDEIHANKTVSGNAMF